MSIPPPGPLVDEAARLAEALLGRVAAAAADGPDLSPELRERLAVAVADLAVAGAGLLRVVAEVATAWGEQSPRGERSPKGEQSQTVDPNAGDTPDTGRAKPRVERIDIG